jgi:alpha-L-arabinofuranosidase
MNSKPKLFLLALAGCGVLSGQSATLTVDASRPGMPISPMLYGIFFEEINHAGDGGLYAEMVQNRTFEERTTAGWSLRTTGSAQGRMSLDTERPLNPANKTSLRVDAVAAGEDGGLVAVVNEGWWGMGIKKGEAYKLSFFARGSPAFRGDLEARLESAAGKVHAAQRISGLTPDWKRFALTLTSDAADPSARLSIVTSSPGTFWLDVVSLFPSDTWKNRFNGTRPDLAELLSDLKPAFLRFPGGCFVEGGNYLRDAFRWKTALGDIAERPGHENARWGYWSTDGLGLHEYLQFAEDLGAEPLYVPNVGVAHREAEPMDRMGDWVQEALDAIEYANGPVTSKWGGIRAKNGHPAPFNLKYVEIGNDIRNQNYIDRYPVFYKAIKARYPELHLIAATKVDDTPVEIIDHHLYCSPEKMRAAANRYDTYDRKEPKVFEGEWATDRDVGKGNLKGALAEAAYMLGFERNADVVVMSSYAPLLYNVEDRTWPVNLIGFDSARAYGTPSYWMQWLFARNRGDVTLPTRVDSQTEKIGAAIERGGIGVGTHGSQAEFRDIRVTQGDRTLFSSDFSGNSPEWRTFQGDWQRRNGSYAQVSRNTERDMTGTVVDFLAYAGDPNWTDYTVSLRARRIAATGDFVVMFRAKDNRNSWFALHVGSSGAYIERNYEQIATRLPGSSPLAIETGRWYQVRIDVQGPRIQSFLDGKPLVSVDNGYSPIELPTMVAGATRLENSGEILLKVVNFLDKAQRAAVRLDGVSSVAPEGTETVLSSASQEDENSLDQPKRVAPVSRHVAGLSRQFDYTFAANSVTFLRIRATK